MSHAIKRRGPVVRATASVLESLERRAMMSATLTGYIVQTGDGTPFHLTGGPTRDPSATLGDVSIKFQDQAGHVDPTYAGTVTITLTDYKTGDVLRTRSVKAVDGVAAFGDFPINYPDAYKLTTTDAAGHIPAVLAFSEQPLPGSRPIDDLPAPIAPTAATITATPAAVTTTPRQARRAAGRAARVAKVAEIKAARAARIEARLAVLAAHRQDVASTTPTVAARLA